LKDLFGFQSWTWEKPRFDIQVVYGRDLHSPQGELEADEQYLYYSGASEEMVSATKDAKDWRAEINCFVDTNAYGIDRYPKLFEEFAKTPDSTEGCAAFAREYGFLYSRFGVSRWPRQWQALRKNEGNRFSGWKQAESVDQWRYVIRLFRTIIGLWKGLEAPDTEELERVLLEGPRYRSEATYEIDQLAIYTRYRCGEEEARLAPDYSTFFIGHCQRMRLAILNECVRDQGFQFSTEFVPHLEGQVALRMPPGNLYTALVFQLFEAMITKKDFRQCEVCGTWFELHPDKARTDKLYCSEACRFKAYRHRQSSAYEMHCQGKSIEDIADALGTSALKVEGWIAKKTKKPVSSTTTEGES